MKRLAVVLALVALLGCSREQPPAPAGPPVELWGIFEQSFTSDADPARAELTVKMRSPAGVEQEVDGFWDGAKTWRVRFMPTEEGEWQYIARWDSPNGTQEDAKGSFLCKRGDSKNPWMQHGRVRVAKDGTHFEYSDGTPFFWLVDTVWNGALLSDDAGWQTYLDDRATKKFTGAQFVITQWRTAPANAEKQVAYTGFDNIEIHPEFFQRIDRRINEVNAKGLLAVPVLLWVPGDKESNPGNLPVEQAIRLARYMVARYQANHVIWFLGGDSPYDGEHTERWRQIGRGVFGDHEHAPVFLHPKGMHWPWEAFKDEEWLSALGYQSGHGDDARTLAWIHSGPPAQHWQDPPIRPIVNLEPPYEDHIAYQSKQRHTAYTVRRAIYWSLMNAPTAGTTYGAHGVWGWHTTHEIPLNHAETGEAKLWSEAIQLPGSTHMKIRAEFFESLPWWKLRPAQAVLAEQPGAKDPAKFVSAARTDDGEVTVLYLPVGGSVKLAADALLEGAAAEWFDPRTGNRTPAEGSKGSYRAPSTEDWVLVVKGAAAK